MASLYESEGVLRVILKSDGVLRLVILVIYAFGEIRKLLNLEI